MSEPTCSIDDCGRAHYGRGYCRRHWRFWRLYGDPLASKHTPNRHSVRDDGVATMVITKLDESEHVVLYDASDAPLVRSYTWFIQPGGYAASTTGSRAGAPVHTLLHRLLLNLGPGDREQVVDHINGKRFDNRRCNLRVVDQMANGANRAVTNGVGTSRFRGVSWDRHRKLWAAHVGLNYKLHHLGRFTTEAEAAAVVASFRVKHGLPSGY